MQSVDKYGRIRKKIDRYVLPLDINPNVILDIIKIEEKKSLSPNKLRQEAIAKLTEESKKMQLLKITGTQMSGNFIIPIAKSVKPKVVQKKVIPQRHTHRYKLHQILNSTFDDIVQIISKDSDSYLFNQQLRQLTQFKALCKTEHQLKKTSAINKIFSQEHSPVHDKNREYYEDLILSNPILYKKVILAYKKLQQAKSQRERERDQAIDNGKAVLSQTFVNKRAVRSHKKPSIIQKQMPIQELKKLNNFIQFREFLLTISLSNKLVIHPQNEAIYKACVCKGNNGLLVKSIIKTRPWWGLRSSSDIDNCNLVWTEWKKSKIIKVMSQKISNKEERLQKNHSLHSSTCQKFNKTTNLQQQHNQQGIDKHSSCKFKPSKTFVRPTNIFYSKLQQLNKLIKLEKYSLSKYVKTDETQINYYSFTRKINEKSFQQISKNFLPMKQVQIQNFRGKDKQVVMHNHLPGCLQLHSKKLLYFNMKRYYQKKNKDVFQNIPQTFVIKDGAQDPSYLKFVQRFNVFETEKNDPAVKNKTKNIWICKPGQNSNRGNGITVVSTLEEIKQQMKTMNKSYNRSLIVQKYMENPYLYNKRKFDIRTYLLVTTVNGIIKAYFFNEGYIRTTSKEYNLKNLQNKFVHLTNDAIQKKGEQYGKFQSCNKVSFAEFQKYLDAIDENQTHKFLEARKKIKELVKQMVKATAYKLNSQLKEFCFELFGLDFMLDAKMKPYLIEANSNPCLEVDGSVLSKIIPSLIENVIRVAIDPIFPPPYSQNWKTSRFSPGNAFEQNKFELIYDSLQDGAKEFGVNSEDCLELQQEEGQCQEEEQNQIQQ